MCLDILFGIHVVLSFPCYISMAFSIRGGGVSIIMTFGKYGGFYIYSGWTKRLCLGWLAITYVPKDWDDIARSM